MLKLKNYLPLILFVSGCNSWYYDILKEQSNDMKAVEAREQYLRQRLESSDNRLNEIEKLLKECELNVGKNTK